MNVIYFITFSPRNPPVFIRKRRSGRRYRSCSQGRGLGKMLCGFVQPNLPQAFHGSIPQAFHEAFRRPPTEAFHRPPTEAFRPFTVKKRKNGFSSVQKFIFYGSNSGKCCSEPYFLWRNTVKRSKSLFLTVPDRPKIRLQMRKSGIYPYW